MGEKEEEKKESIEPNLNKSDLPVVRDNESLSVRMQRNIPKVIDGLKRTGKIVAYTAGALGCLGASATVAPVAGMIGFTLFAAGSINNVLYKKAPSLMFVTRKSFGETQIFQNAGIPDIVRLSSYDRVEKGSLMALQTLIGFSRYKDALKGSPYTVEDGQKVYTERMSTVTHGMNIKNLQMLEKLGYIKIDSIEDRFKRGLGKVLPGNPRPKKSLMIAEKLGFGNFEDIRKIGKAFFTGDRKTLDEMKKDFSKISFRFTDKEIDIEDLYSKFNGEKQYESQDEKIAIKRFFPILHKTRGLFATKGIGISRDRFGRQFIDYKPEKSFIELHEEAIRNRKNSDESERQAKTFDEELREGVAIDATKKGLEEHARQEGQAELTNDESNKKSERTM